MPDPCSLLTRHEVSNICGAQVDRTIKYQTQSGNLASCRFEPGILKLSISRGTISAQLTESDEKFIPDLGDNTIQSSYGLIIFKDLLPEGRNLYRFSLELDPLISYTPVECSKDKLIELARIAMSRFRAS